MGDTARDLLICASRTIRVATYGKTLVAIPRSMTDRNTISSSSGATMRLELIAQSEISAIGRTSVQIG